MDSLSAILILLMFLFVYFIPSMVARSRYHRNAAAIFVINLFLGWTLAGWVIALAWAVMVPPSNMKELT